MLIPPRKLVVVGLQRSLYETLMSMLGMRAGVDEVTYHYWYNPNDEKIEPSPDVMVLEAARDHNLNRLRIWVRDIAFAHPLTKIVVAAYGMPSGSLAAHAVVHSPSLEELAEAIKPLLPSGTIDA